MESAVRGATSPAKDKFFAIVSTVPLRPMVKQEHPAQDSETLLMRAARSDRLIGESCIEVDSWGPANGTFD
jgi:hypothetical protein